MLSERTDGKNSSFVSCRRERGQAASLPQTGVVSANRPASNSKPLVVLRGQRHHPWHVLSGLS